MARPRKVPWVAIQIDLLESGKLAQLPSDTAMLGWVAVLLAAKTQKRMGVFDSDRHFRLVTGRFGRFLARYLSAGLLERAAGLCAKCRPMHPNLDGGEVVVHDYRREQRDPTHVERQRGYDAKGREPDDVSDDEPDDVSDGFPTPLSRAGPTTVTETVTVVPLSSSPAETPRRDAPRPPAEPKGDRPGNGAVDDWTAVQKLVETLTQEHYALPNRHGGHGATVHKLLVRHGRPRLESALRSAAEAVEVQPPTVKQIVFAAGDLLDAVPKVGRRDVDEREREALRQKYEGGRR